MDETSVRGELLAHTASFLRDTYDEGTHARIHGELSLELQSVLAAIDHAAWYPQSFHAELLGAVARVRGHDQATYADFVRCGEQHAAPRGEVAQLLLKVLTPELFIKKLPRFWASAHRGATLEVEQTPDTGSVRRVRLSGLDRYEHGAIVWLGFMQGMLAQLAPSGTRIEQQGWSWTTPAPRDVVYQVRWT